MKRKYNFICAMLLAATYVSCIVRGFMRSVDDGLLSIAASSLVVFAILKITSYERNV